MDNIQQDVRIIILTFKIVWNLLSLDSGIPGLSHTDILAQNYMSQGKSSQGACHVIVWAK
jgi:hypothetical protein